MADNESLGLMAISQTPGRTVAWSFTALALGLIVGWTDLSAGAVQGPVLLLMVSAFVLSLAGARPAWLIAVSAALGIPAMHLVAAATGSDGEASWGMLVAIVPGLLAAYGGVAVGWLLHAAADLLGVDTRTRAQSLPLLTLVIAGCTAVGVLPVWATLNARAQPITWWVTLWWQVVTLVSWAAVTPLLLRTRRSSDPGTSGVTARWVLHHLALIVTIAVLHSIGLALLTRILMVPLGPAEISGAAKWAFAAYLPMDGLTYVLVSTFAWASDADRLARAAAQQSAALSADLVRAQLEALRAQLQPHFLFNALNAVTVLARRENASAAAEATETLAELLRYELEAGGRGPVRLEQELEFTRKYLGLERLRFGDRLEYSIDADASTREAEVPALLLQPLVENAVQHGVARRKGGRISISAIVIDGQLRVQVENQSLGVAEASSPNLPGERTGIGLSNLRARLLVMYGDRADLALSTAAPDRAVASLRLPLDRAQMSLAAGAST
jgi:two-component system LytT family sensor kinase